MRNPEFLSYGPRPTALARLWIAIVLTFLALGIALAFSTQSSAAAVERVRSDIGQLTGAEAARIDRSLQDLQAQTRRSALWMAALLTAAAAFVHLPAGLAMTRDLRRSHLHLARERRALTRLRAEMAQLSERALHDDTTGLPNGPGFQAALDRWGAVDGDPISALVLEVAAGAGPDRLPEDSYLSIASTLRDGLEGNLVLSRLSETEFGILTRDAPDRLADRILGLLDQPLRHDRAMLKPQVRIGYAVQRKGESLDLLQGARSALRRARSSPLDPVVPYTDAIRASETTAARLTRDLPDALVDGQIAASFQPQISLHTGKLTGVEALARWQHPHFGELAPEQFFPVVRAAGLSYELDRQVWSHALRQLTHWRRQDLSIPQLALNASVETISDPGILRRVLAQLSGLGLTASDISIEVPAHVFGTTGATDAALNVERLMAAGIRVELDGLGCDLSSVIDLPERGLSGVKLDHALAATDPTPGRARSVRAMMSLLRELQIPASAKGIETDDQSRRMANVGCVRMQGNLVSAPMDARSFRRWVSAGAPAIVPTVQPAE